MSFVAVHFLMPTMLLGAPRTSAGDFFLIVLSEVFCVYGVATIVSAIVIRGNAYVHDMIMRCTALSSVQGHQISEVFCVYGIATIMSAIGIRGDAYVRDIFLPFTALSSVQGHQITIFASHDAESRP